LVVRFAAGGLVARFGGRTVTIAAFLVAAVGTVPFAVAGPGTSLVWPSTVLFVRGLGIGAVLIPPMSLAYRDVGPESIAHASIHTRILQQVGASFGTAIVEVVLQFVMVQSDESGSTVSAYQASLWAAVGISIAALIPAFALPGRDRERDWVGPGSEGEAGGEGIARVEHELRGGGQPGASGDRRHHGHVVADVCLLDQAAGEGGADEGLVDEVGVQPQLPTSVADGHEGAGPGAAGRTIEPARVVDEHMAGVGPVFRLRGQEHHVLAAAVSGDGMDRFCLVVDGGHDVAAGGDEVLGTVALEADAFVSADLVGSDEGV